MRLPEIPKNVLPQKVLIAKENPFHMPPDHGVFAMREQDKNLKLEVPIILKGQMKEKMKHLKIHEKNVEKRKNFKALLADDADDIAFYQTMKKRDSDKILVNKKSSGTSASKPSRSALH